MLGILMVATLLGTALPALFTAMEPLSFGGAAVLLATRLYGIRWGLVAVLLAGGFVLALWLPVTSAALLAVEVLVVGMLFRRGMNTILVADIIFWAAFGLPLLWLLHGILLRSGSDAVLLIMARCGGGGLLNALLATLAFRLIPSQRKQGNFQPSLWESQLNLLLTCLLLPALVLAGIHLYGPKDFARPGLVAEMAAACSEVAEQLQEKHAPIERALLELASRVNSTKAGGAELQPHLETLRSRFAPLIGILVADSEGQPLASSAAELPEPITDSTEPLFTVLRDSRQQTFSTAWSRGAHPAPALTWGLPLVVDGRLIGFVKAAIDARDAQTVLSDAVPDPFQISLLDHGGTVVASTNPRHRPLEDYFQRPSDPLPLTSPGTYIWRPQDGSFTALSPLRSLVPAPLWPPLASLDIPRGEGHPWGIALEVPSASYLAHLRNIAARSLVLMLLPALLAMALIRLTNRRLLAPLAELRDTSSHLAEKIRNGQTIRWPVAPALEVSALCDNFKAVTVELERRQQTTNPQAERSAEALDDVLAQHNWEIFTAGRKLQKEMDRRKRIEGLIAELEAAESKYRFLVEKSMVGVYILTGDRFAYINPRFAEIFGYSQREITRTLTLTDLAAQEDRVLVAGNLRRQELGEVDNQQYRFKGVRKDGRCIHVEVLNGSGSYDGKTAIIGTLLDITARVEAEEKIEHMAYHDPLTGLPNRLLFADRANQAMVYAERTQQMVGMLFLDLDRFKGVNDTLGHAAGDRLLREVAERLKDCLRESDTISRFGGDEFNILVTQMKEESDATLVAHKTLRAMKYPFRIEEQELYITCSIGIALFPRDCDDLQDLMKNADTALYRAKDLGRNNYQIYSPAMNARALERMALESSLRRVLERNELRVYYQPQVDMQTGRIIGVEALVRWQHSIGEMIQPSTFIPLAEEIGLIAPIGEWVLRTACHQAMAWQSAGFPPLRIGINVSARQLHEPDFADIVTFIVRESGIDPKWINIEITESVVVEDVREAIEKFRQLHDVGITVAIDDFGIGYSSLSYLRNFPADQLKIDRSFVQNLPHETNDANIARHIVDMAHEVGLTVIAEGVETGEQYAFLRAIGCDEVQGFLVSKPVPAEALLRLLQEGKNFSTEIKGDADSERDKRHYAAPEP